MKERVDEAAKDFSSQSHGSSDWDKEDIYVQGSSDEEFIPLSCLNKKYFDEPVSIDSLQGAGYVVSSCNYLELAQFDRWFHQSFKKKLTLKAKKRIKIIHFPDKTEIFKAVEIVNQVYSILKSHKVLINGKNLPVQLGEWYAKSIFGLHQIKSSSQRGFDFIDNEGKVVEVKIHWQDVTSPKGVKLKKSLLDLSDYVIIMYVAKNFTIRDILFLDSDFVLRKFSEKGYTIFIKDTDVTSYFFSRSDKHLSKIVNMPALLKFSTPNFAMKLDERLNSKNEN